MTVVCGTDFSEPAMQAANVAAALALRLREPLVLVHSRDEFAELKTTAGVWGSLSAALREQLGKEAERLRQLVLAQQPDAPLTVMEKLAGGPPDEVMRACAEQSQARLVVVASLGRGGALRALLGSVAERTAQSSPVPVLVVRSAEPLLGWLAGIRPLRITVAADFSATADAALSLAAMLCRLGPCDVLVGHIAWPPQEHRRLGIGGPMDLVQIHPDVERVLHRELSAKVQERLGAAARIEIRAGFGRPADHLIQMAEADKADLVVVGTHQRHGINRAWHGSVSCGVLHYAPMTVGCAPVATVAESPPRSIPTIQRVLAATDLSPMSNLAVAHAYSLLPTGGVVHLIHVADTATMLHSVHAYDPGGHHPSPQEKAEHAAYLAGCLSQMIPPEAEARGIQTLVEVIDGRDVVNAICSTAERHGVDVICLASHGRSGLAKMLLGSVAQGVVTRSTLPLFVIRSRG